MNRDFKGVWIPKEIWLNEELTLLEKIIFVEIDSLDNEDHCIAGNEYFAEFCNCSESKVSKAIKKLKDLNMIEELSFDGRHRKLRVVKNDKESSKKCYSESQKMLSNNIDNKQTNKDNSKELLLNKNSDFQFGKSKPKKENLYTKCVNLIDGKTDDAQIRSLLINWLNMLIEKYKDRDRVLYANVFKGKLNMLDKYDEKDWKEIIEYNLQRGYEGFYPLPVSNYNNYDVRKGKPWEEGVTSNPYSDDELLELRRIDDEREAQGLRTRF